MNLQMKQNRSEFVELLYSTGREGMDEVIGQLEELGFFQAPASSKFHLNHEGGLLEHSLNVCKVGLMLREQMLALKPDLEESLNKESVIIAALLHDICKADIYQKCIRKRKDRLGQWVDYETYELDYSDFPLGHGDGLIGRRNHGYPLAHVGMGPAVSKPGPESEFRYCQTVVSALYPDSSSRRTGFQPAGKQRPGRNLLKQLISNEPETIFRFATDRNRILWMNLLLLPLPSSFRQSR